MTLDEPQGNEITTQIDGIEVLISEEVQRLAETSTIDHDGGGFTIGLEVFSGF
jgi:hypothetical protein